MKKFSVVILAVLCMLGCARVSVQGSKEPIKVDISMRLDIYQHVENDINAIEGMISGPKTTAKPADKQSFLSFIIGTAFAQEGLDPEVEQAALRRKSRIDALYAFESKGVIGENKAGMVEIRDAAGSADDAKQLIAQENNDRMIIYKAIAAKNSVPVADIQKLYAKRLQNDAPSGTPVEVLVEISGSFGWKIK